VAASACPPDPGEAGRARPRIVRLKRRAEFLAAARGRRAAAPGFVLQACRRPDGGDEVGVGLTVTRRIGGAVVRNRARRRLREAVRSIPGESFARGLNYVVVARPAALTCPFPQLRSDLEACLARLRPPPAAAA
jgi:ribonuclease P protein component